jgi:hypothetical protein
MSEIIGAVVNKRNEIMEYWNTWLKAYPPQWVKVGSAGLGFFTNGYIMRKFDRT